jgi:acyl carrier protein
MDIKAQLEIVFRDVFDDDGITISDEMTASDLEDWDSLSHIQLIVAIEQAFSVRFKTSEIVGLKNVGEFMSTLKNKCDKNQSNN